MARDQQLIVLDGSTFFVSDPAGDLDADGADGFFFADTRHLSRWLLRVNAAPVTLLTSRATPYFHGRIVATLPSAHVGENPPVTIRRDRLVSEGLHEDILIENHSNEPRTVEVALEFDADFADIFEIKQDKPKRGRRWAEKDTNHVTLWYQHGNFRRGTRVALDTPCDLYEDRAVIEVRLAARGRWRTCVEVSCLVDDELHPPHRTCHDPRPFGTDPVTDVREWLADTPRLESGFDPLRLGYRHCLLDLAALRFRPLEDLRWALPAAGLPWFMALFGRDSLITAYQALPFQPHLARSTLMALAAYQATGYNDFRDAEPGKILHELRRGELATLGEIPHSPYYGSHDATPLFLILLDEYERWTGDHSLVRELQPAALAAIGWLEGPGDLDGDGYLEYQTRSSEGLVHQGWKDSGNAILFADGRGAEPPIATCEIQGYAYDARRRAARLARMCWGDAALAERLERDATALRERFNRDFWVAARGHYALALDRDKRQVDALTSNIGHLLWSGILDEGRAGETVARLMDESLFSGWGIRTMATGDLGFNPIEYHNGTVWPHDTAIVAEGMRRYGYRAEASAIALALFEALEEFDYRLPEVFAGFPRAETVIPVEYPTASRPQAWAVGSLLLALRTLLGMDVRDGRLEAEPVLPAPLGDLRLLGVMVRGRRHDVPG